MSDNQPLPTDQWLNQQNMAKLPGAAVSIRDISRLLNICVDAAQKGLDEAIRVLEILNERAEVPDSAPYSKPETREEEQLGLDIDE